MAVKYLYIDTHPRVIQHEREYRANIPATRCLDFCPRFVPIYRMTSNDDYQPIDVRDNRYAVIGAMQRKQRRVYCVIMNRSALGLWTSYAQMRDEGIGRPSKRLSELIDVHGVDIKKRYVQGSSREIEFCL